MIEHLLLPINCFLIIFYPKYFIISLIFIFTISKFVFTLSKQKIYKYYNYYDWIKENKIKFLIDKNNDINDIYNEIYKIKNLYQILEYVEKKKEFWKKGLFKNDKNGMQKQILYYIENIKNKNINNNYLIEIITSYIHICYKSYISKKKDIDIIQLMHNSKQNLMLHYKIIEIKDTVEFNSLTRDKKFVYQIYLSSIIENFNK
jgi:hypothetical protein